MKLKEKSFRFHHASKKAISEKSLETVSGGVNIPEDDGCCYFELIDKCPRCRANLYGCCEAGYVIQIGWVVCLKCGYEHWE
jgi:hypothetical protein